MIVLRLITLVILSAMLVSPVHAQTACLGGSNAIEIETGETFNFCWSRNSLTEDIDGYEVYMTRLGSAINLEDPWQEFSDDQCIETWCELINQAPFADGNWKIQVRAIRGTVKGPVSSIVTVSVRDPPSQVTGCSARKH